jgi:hypothetical protein
MRIGLLSGVIAAVSLLTLLAVCLAEQKGTSSLPIIIDPDNDSCTSSNTAAHADCASACKQNAIGCATAILNHIRSDDFTNRRVLNPGTIKRKPNIQTPMHGLFVPTWVNTKLEDAIKQAVKAPFEEVDMPDWSISAKLNHNPHPDPGSDVTTNLEWATVMYKIPGYCPQHIFPSSGACVGGEWFWFLFREDKFEAFDFELSNNSSVPAWGKAETFCLDCHAAVADADWLWITHDQIRRAQQKAKPSRSSSQTPGQTGAGLCSNVTELSHQRPADVAYDPASLATPEKRQRMFDCYAWETFIALNWPADTSQRGVPDKTGKIGDPGERVWETYKQVYEMFQPDDSTWTLASKHFDDSQPLPSACKPLMETGDAPATKVLTFQVLNETHQAFGNQFNTLVDQNGRVTHYNIRVNRDAFNFLKQKEYSDTGNYDYNGPVDSAATIDFPDNQTSGFSGEGATEIKSAWRELCTSIACKKVDDPTRYYTRQALIYSPELVREIDPRGDKQPPKPATQAASCRKAQVGLVGFHVAAKTFWAPQWIWPTFEHVDNVPGLSPNNDVSYSYHDAACSPAVSQTKCLQQRPGILKSKYKCCANLQNIPNAHPAPGAGEKPSLAVLSPIPNQLTRIDGIEKSAAVLNSKFRKLLATAKSPFQHYVLISTQWPKRGRLSESDYPKFGLVDKLCLKNDEVHCFTFMPEGLRLRNSVIESFQVSYCAPDDEDIGNDPVKCTPDGVVENPIQSSSGGCMNCHFSSGTDSSYIWADAIEEKVPL